MHSWAQRQTHGTRARAGCVHECVCMLRFFSVLSCFVFWQMCLHVCVAVHVVQNSCPEQAKPQPIAAPTPDIPARLHAYLEMWGTDLPPF